MFVRLNYDIIQASEKLKIKNVELKLMIQKSRSMNQLLFLAIKELKVD